MAKTPNPKWDKHMSDSLFQLAVNHAGSVGEASGFLSGIETNSQLPKFFRLDAERAGTRLSESFNELRIEIESQATQMDAIRKLCKRYNHPGCDHGAHALANKILQLADPTTKREFA